MTALDARPSAAAELYDALAPGYDASFSRPVDLAENSVVQAWLHGHVRWATSVLDLGCGAGAFLDLFPEWSGSNDPVRSYTGIDVSEGMLARGREKHPWARFIQGDMRHHDSTRHDLVVCLFGSCNYVPLYAFEQAARRALLSRGRLFAIFLTPAYLSRQHYGYHDGTTLWEPVTANRLRVEFQLWDNVRLRPLDVLGELLDTWPLSYHWLHPYLRLESKIAAGLGQTDRASFIVLEAQLP